MNIPPAVDSSFWVNGILDGNFDPRDPGLLSGLSIFETMRTYGTHIFRLEDHYERLLNSARAVANNDAPPLLANNHAQFANPVPGGDG